MAKKFKDFVVRHVGGLALPPSAGIIWVSPDSVTMSKTLSYSLVFFLVSLKAVTDTN